MSSVFKASDVQKGTKLPAFEKSLNSATRSSTLPLPVTSRYAFASRTCSRSSSR